MEETPLNVALGEEIEKWLAFRGKTKASLAKFLDVDAPTMSLLLKGQKLFSMSQLEKIFIHLSVDEGGREVMRRMLSYLLVRSRSRNVWDSGSLKAMRLRRGLSLPMLSNRTGIMTSRLALLEMKNAARPTEDEDAKLRKVFEGTGDNRYESEYVDTFSLKDAVVPLLSLADLNCLRNGVKLSAIIRERSVEDSLWMLHHTGSLAAVAANCEDLQLAMPGMVILAIAENSDTTPHKMELWRSPDGEYSLCELVGKVWKQSVFSLPDTEFKVRELALPVLDLVFKPYDLETEGR